MISWTEKPEHPLFVIRESEYKNIIYPQSVIIQITKPCFLLKQYLKIKRPGADIHQKSKPSQSDTYPLKRDR